MSDAFRTAGRGLPAALAKAGGLDAGAPPLLAVEHLTVGFDIDRRLVPAVIGVTFNMRAGETLCLVGESGSGKTLTALSIIRLLPGSARVTSGSVRLNHRDLLTLAEREMERVRGGEIGFVFQEPSAALNPVFTIGRQIEETLRIHNRATRRTARSRAIELLEQVRIPEPHRRVDDYPHQLSGGLKQRAVIALALAGQPKLLIADEPTTALDVTIQAEILDLLMDLRERLRLGMLLITHDLGIVAQTADRVAVMYGGRIVEHAPVKALFANPKHPYTRSLLDSIPGRKPGSRLHAIPGSVPALGSLPAGCSFVTRCPARFEPCSKAHPGDTVFGARPDQHSVKCYLHGGAVEQLGAKG
jgi:oligopeptide/dipeptide ABC transporter ATP-binding protein